MSIARNCDFCQQEYQAESRYLNRGQGRYCSRLCAGKDKWKDYKAPDDNAICAYCSETFYHAPSKKIGSKSGLHFCCREHKDLAQRMGGISEIQPPHYGTSLASYRTKAFRFNKPTCVRCGWNKIPEILEVNHIDCDRSNNDIANLEILCPTCHAQFHFETKTGYWAKRGAVSEN